MIENHTCILQAPNEWDSEASCRGLPVRYEEQDGLLVGVSCWEPTPAELTAIAEGGKVYLSIVIPRNELGGRIGHPPVMIYA